VLGERISISSTGFETDCKHLSVEVLALVLGLPLDRQILLWVRNGLGCVDILL
jgi:hypothetical protein